MVLSLVWVPPDLDPCTASAWGWVLEALGATCGWGGLDGRGRGLGSVSMMMPVVSALG